MEWYKKFFDEVYLSFLEERIPKGERESLFIDMLLKFYERQFNQKFDRILDCGCGIGRHAIPLAKAGYKVTGIDTSEIYIKYAKEWAKREKVKIQFKVADMRKLPFPSNKFDILLSLFTTFGYFSEKENFKVLMEFKRVVRKGGLIFIDVPNRKGVESFFSPLRCSETEEYLVLNYDKQVGKSWISEWKIYKKIGDQLEFICKKVSKVRLYTREELERIGKRAGFKVVDFFSGFSLTPFEDSSRRMLAVFMV